jgi:hypothetical protein
MIRAFFLLQSFGVMLRTIFIQRYPTTKAASTPTQIHSNKLKSGIFSSPYHTVVLPFLTAVTMDKQEQSCCPVNIPGKPCTTDTHTEDST